ncbi:Phosphoglucomutase [Salix suchowensis]|nr:Phosphoglucomutase [Salix suchowensis]
MVKFVNTSMHGVSNPFVTRGFELFGLPPFVAVEEQRNPDPDFPTVPFPNPEEKAIRTAEREGAQYVLAQDPDSDRFAAAEKGPDGKWIVFTGDQLGAFFASRELAIYKQSGKPLEKLAMVASTVSSKMIEAMAHVEGFKFVECLTGPSLACNLPFLFDTNAMDLFRLQVYWKHCVDACGARFRSAIRVRGSDWLHVWPLIRDKDGVAATTASSSNTATSPTHSDATYPSKIAGLTVASIIDLTTGYDSTNAPSFKPRLPLSSGHMIQFRAGNDEVKIVLTTRCVYSVFLNMLWKYITIFQDEWTEPKIKYYLEGSGRDRAKVEAILPKVVEELGRDWMEAEKHSLGSPSARVM